MKKQILNASVLIFAAVASLSCHKEPVAEGGSEAGTDGSAETRTVYFYTEPDEVTKVRLVDAEAADGSGDPVRYAVWEAGDEVTIYYHTYTDAGEVKKEDYCEATFDGYEDGKARFKATGFPTDRTDNPNADPNTADTLYAVYKTVSGANPFIYEPKQSRHKGRITVGANGAPQKALKDSIDINGVPMVSQWVGRAGDTPLFKFKNTCGFLSFDIDYGEGWELDEEWIDSVYFTSSAVLYYNCYYDYLKKTSTAVYNGLFMKMSSRYTDNLVRMGAEKMDAGRYSFYMIPASAQAPQFIFKTNLGRFRSLAGTKTLAVTRSKDIYAGEFTMKPENFAEIKLSIGNKNVKDMQTIIRAYNDTSVTLTVYCIGEYDYYLDKQAIPAATPTGSGTGITTKKINLPSNKSRETKHHTIIVKKKDSETSMKFYVDLSRQEGVAAGEGLTEDIMDGLVAAIPDSAFKNKSYKYQDFTIKPTGNIKPKVNSSTSLQGAYALSFINLIDGDVILNFTRLSINKGSSSPKEIYVFVNDKEVHRYVGDFGDSAADKKTFTDEKLTLEGMKVGDEIKIALTGSDYSSIGTFTLSKNNPQ